MAPQTDAAQLRRWVYHLVIAVAFAIAVGRIVSVQRVYEPAFHKDPEKKEVDRRPIWPATRPDSNAMFGSNDRARWATIRALVHDGTYVIGQRDLSQPDGIRTDVADPRSHSGIIFKPGFKEHGWATIDRVMDPETGKFYSSKPPMLATLLSCIYWVLFKVFGLSLIDQPVIVVRIMLIMVNALPFAGYLWLLTQVAERWGKTDWGKLFVVIAGAFATMVSPFMITLQNHTFATFSVMLALWSMLCIWDRMSSSSARTEPGTARPLNEEPGWQHLISAGFFAAFAVTNELPALSFASAILVLLMWLLPRQTLLWFVPVALIPVIFYFATNYAAMGQLRPVQSEFEGSKWYEYEGSHWMPPLEGQKKYGIDWAKLHESRAAYALHVLIGHHGWFSLTPIWILAAIAMIAGSVRALMRRAGSVSDGHDDFRWFVQPMGLAVSVVVIAFYLLKTTNYSGFSNGLRWLMWMTPLWLTCLIPMADRLAVSRVGRWIGGICLAGSIFSVSYQLWSPWRHPWIFDLMVQCGWSAYQ